jgi:short-subunit dehydrogenase
MNKTVFITGASSGMGRATALFLAKKGFHVYAGSRSAQKLTKLHPNITPIMIDITQPESIQKALSPLPTIDILVNNAGYGLVSTVEEVTEEQMLTQFNVNLFGTLRISKALIPNMRKQQYGIIINISSFLGKIGLPLLTFYNASKYAMEGITDSLRYELAPFNIRVHSIMPGFFDTNFARENLVINNTTFSPSSPYNKIVSTLAPTIIKEINHGNNAQEIATLIYEIILDKTFKARVTAGEKAQKFIPMKKELSDEDFERRVKEYYNLG